MESEFKAANPDAIVMEMTMKMPLGHWRKLQKQLANAYPAWDLSSAIQGMIRKAETHFYPEPEDGGRDG